MISITIVYVERLKVNGIRNARKSSENKTETVGIIIIFNLNKSRLIQKALFHNVNKYFPFVIERYISFWVRKRPLGNNSDVAYNEIQREKRRKRRT